MVIGTFEFECCNSFIEKNMKRLNAKQMSEVCALLDTRNVLLEAYIKYDKKAVKEGFTDTPWYETKTRALLSSDDMVQAMFVEKVHEIFDELKERE